MRIKKIYSEDGKGYITVFSHDKVEKVNPIEYYKINQTKKEAIMIRNLVDLHSPGLSDFLGEEYFLKKAQESTEEFLKKVEQVPVHSNFLKLLETTKKRDQEKLLRNMTLNPEELLSLAFKAYKDFGFLYSQYRFENLPNGFENKRLPHMFYLDEGGTLIKSGETDLSDGELKNVLKQRSVVVSHFFEKDNEWHCFFLTYNSIGGKENHNNGQPHFHYISSAFGISKEDFIASMEIGKYRSTSIHIDLLDFGNQPK